MLKNCNLLPNSKLECVELGDELGVFRKVAQKTSINAIIRIPYDYFVKLEEIPTEDENESKIIVVEYSFDDPRPPIIPEYKITSYHYNVISHHIYKGTTYLSKTEPEKISSKYYLYQDSKNKLCLVDTDINVVYLINPKLEEIVEITNPEINCFDKKKNPSIYELEFDINDAERLHTFLKIDEEVKVHNVFYSEMKKGMPLTVYYPGDESEYLDVKDFYERLLNHPILDEITKKEKSIQTTKKKIRKKESYSNIL